MTDLQRLKKIINWLIFIGCADNERALAERLGYSRSSFSQIVTGKIPLSDKFLQKITSLDKNINKDWVKTGAGSMLKQSLYSDAIGGIQSAIVNESTTPYYGGFSKNHDMPETDDQQQYYKNLLSEKDRCIALLEKNAHLLEKHISILEKQIGQLEKRLNELSDTSFIESPLSKNAVSSKGKTVKNNVSATTLG